MSMTFFLAPRHGADASPRRKQPRCLVAPPLEPIMSDAPRIPRKLDPNDDGEPIAPHIEVLLLLVCTAGAIAGLWGAWELWRWFVRVLLS